MTTSSSHEAKRPSVLMNTASYIIVTEFCERLAYYGFAGSLVLFFQTRLDMSNEDAVNQFYAWNGFVYVTPLIGGYIADTILGRYKTILTFAIIYLVGLTMFLVGSIPGAILAALVFFAMYTVALGAGGIKPNVSTMGADQFDLKIAQDKEEADKFFSYFYWSINLGALIAYSVVAYICQYGIPFLGGPDWGFFVGYLIPTAMMGVGIMIFMSGTKRYKKNKPQGSMLSTVGKILVEAAYTRRQVTPSSGHWLDRASEEHGGSHSANDVEGVKYVSKLVPFLAVMIPYWGIYGQTKTAFQIQGCQMNLELGSFELPVSAMNMFNNIAILALVPLFDQVVYPRLKASNKEWSMLYKIGLGFVFALLAMIVAALIEMYRLKLAPDAADYYDHDARDNISPCRNIDNYNPHEFQKWYAGDSDTEPTDCHKISGCDIYNDDDDAYLALECIKCSDIPQMSRLSIFWQIPQFVIIGVSEIFASITSLEFFYSQAPRRMRSVSQASNLFTNAMGSWLTIPLTILVNINRDDQWVTSNVDEGHLEYYFYLLAGLMFTALMVFWWLSSGFQYVEEDELAKLDVAPQAEEPLLGSIEDEDKQPKGRQSSRTISNSGKIEHEFAAYNVTEM